MSALELTNKVQELRELRRMAEELAGEIDTLQDQIKALKEDETTKALFSD